MAKNEFTCDCDVVHEDVVHRVRQEMYDDIQIERTAAFFKIFGDITRMKILCALDKNEMCVCDIANLLSMTKSAVSHQLAALRKANMVVNRRDGKTVYYSLADTHIYNLIETGIEHTNEGER